MILSHFVSDSTSEEETTVDLAKQRRLLRSVLVEKSSGSSVKSHTACFESHTTILSTLCLLWYLQKIKVLLIQMIFESFYL